MCIKLQLLRKLSHKGNFSPCHLQRKHYFIAELILYAKFPPPFKDYNIIVVILSYLTKFVFARPLRIKISREILRAVARGRAPPRIPSGGPYIGLLQIINAKILHVNYGTEYIHWFSKYQSNIINKYAVGFLKGQFL